MLFRSENAVVCLSACPKYDGQDFIDKLTVILEHNNLRKLTFYQMHEECCLVSNSTIECLIKRIKNRTFSVHVNIISRYGQVISELSIN